MKSPFICKQPFDAWGRAYATGQRVDPKDWKTDQRTAAEAFANRIREGFIVSEAEYQVQLEEQDRGPTPEQMALLALGKGQIPPIKDTNFQPEDPKTDLSDKGKTDFGGKK